MDTEIENHPDFAVVWSFFGKFGKHLDLEDILLADITSWISEPWTKTSKVVDMMVKLMRKTGMRVDKQRWQKFITKAALKYDWELAVELQTAGFQTLSISRKLKILKMICEMQFDDNMKFKSVINTEEADDQRLKPVGRDEEGLLYWHQEDTDLNIRLYIEDEDDDDYTGWKVVCRTKDEIGNLISKLTDEPAHKVKGENSDEEEDIVETKFQIFLKTQCSSDATEDKMKKFLQTNIEKSIDEDFSANMKLENAEYSKDNDESKSVKEGSKSDIEDENSSNIKQENISIKREKDSPHLLDLKNDESSSLKTADSFEESKSETKIKLEPINSQTVEDVNIKITPAEPNTTGDEKAESCDTNIESSKPLQQGNNEGFVASPNINTENTINEMSTVPKLLEQNDSNDKFKSCPVSVIMSTVSTENVSVIPSQNQEVSSETSKSSVTINEKKSNLESTTTGKDIENKYIKNSTVNAPAQSCDQQIGSETSKSSVTISGNVNNIESATTGKDIENKDMENSSENAPAQSCDQELGSETSNCTVTLSKKENNLGSVTTGEDIENKEMENSTENAPSDQSRDQELGSEIKKSASTMSKNENNLESCEIDKQKGFDIQNKDASNYEKIDSVQSVNTSEPLEEKGSVSHDTDKIAKSMENNSKNSLPVQSDDSETKKEKEIIETIDAQSISEVKSQKTDESAVEIKSEIAKIESKGNVSGRENLIENSCPPQSDNGVVKENGLEIKTTEKTVSSIGMDDIASVSQPIATEKGIENTGNKNDDIGLPPTTDSTDKGLIKSDVKSSSIDILSSDKNALMKSDIVENVDKTSSLKSNVLASESVDSIPHTDLITENINISHKSPVHSDDKTEIKFMEDMISSIEPAMSKNTDEVLSPPTANEVIEESSMIQKHSLNTCSLPEKESPTDKTVNKTPDDIENREKPQTNITLGSQDDSFDSSKRNTENSSETDKQKYNQMIKQNANSSIENEVASNIKTIDSNSDTKPSVDNLDKKLPQKQSTESETKSESQDDNDKAISELIDDKSPDKIADSTGNVTVKEENAEVAENGQIKCLTECNQDTGDKIFNGESENTREETNKDQEEKENNEENVEEIKEKKSTTRKRGRKRRSGFGRKKPASVKKSTPSDTKRQQNHKPKKPKLSKLEQLKSEAENILYKEKNSKHSEGGAYTTRSGRRVKSAKQEETEAWQTIEDDSASKKKKKGSDVDEDFEYVEKKKSSSGSHRTERVKEEPKKEVKRVINDDTPCMKCGLFSHPETILLCDGCDKGHHMACLTPPLMIVPYEEWFCPKCSQEKLIKRLKEIYEELDSKLKLHQRKTRQNEYKKLLNEYTGISQTNILPEKAAPVKSRPPPKKRRRSYSSESEDLYSSEPSSPEVITTRRCRTKVSYDFSTFDKTIMDAIKDDIDIKSDEQVEKPISGKDIRTIIAAEKGEDVDEIGDDDTTPGRRKKRKLTNLNTSGSEAAESGSNYSISASEEEPSDEEFQLSGVTDSDDSLGGKRRSERKKRPYVKPIKRSKRLRRKRIQEEYETSLSESSEYEEAAPKRTKTKKKKRFNQYGRDSTEDEYVPPRRVNKVQEFIDDEEEENEEKNVKKPRRSRTLQSSSEEGDENKNKNSDIKNSAKRKDDGESSDDWSSLSSNAARTSEDDSNISDAESTENKTANT
ncbi:uncharacterized protein LOC120328032 [Styela clava]